MDRFGGVEFDEGKMDFSLKVRSRCMALESMLGSIHDSREKSIALTKLEEFFMWTNKALAKDIPDSVKITR
jgi:hypothetical protein